MTMNTKINELKESGNEAFKKGEYGIAVQYYTDAICCLVTKEQSEQEVAAVVKAEDALQKCFNNRSQCYLKLGKFAKAADDATKGELLSLMVSRLAAVTKIFTFGDLSYKCCTK